MSSVTKEKTPVAGEQGGVFSDQQKTLAVIVPNNAANSNAFAVEQLATPLREPASIAQVLIRFDAREPLPADAMSRVLAAICDARRRALTVAAIPAKARPFWAGATDE